MHTTNDEQEHKYLSMLVKGSLYFEAVVGKSKIHGKGLYAKKKIPARKKIGSLAGEIISKKTAREKAKLNESISLDASNVYNVLRYINHSCKPNTYMRTIDHHVEFYALRSIRPDEELTCNYGPTHHDGKKECRCGAPGCKGFI